jgi:hypothetical protein
LVATRKSPPRRTNPDSFGRLDSGLAERVATLEGGIEKSMRNKPFVILWLVAVAVILCLSLVACQSPKATPETTPQTIPETTLASAGAGLSLTPFASIKLDVTPGDKVTQQMALSLGAQDQAMDIAVDVMGFGISLDGTPQAIAPAQDTSPYSARPFITVNTSSFQLKPGKSQNIIATITVPANVGAGGRFAIIYIHQQIPAGGTGAQSASSFNIPVLLTIKGSTFTQTGKITSLSTSAVTSGQPIRIMTDFQNTGNIYFKVKGEVTVTDAQGRTLHTMSIPLTASSIIPGATREIQTDFTPTNALAAGTYTIDSKVTLADGTLLDKSTSTFEVTTDYVPPAGT